MRRLSILSLCLAAMLPGAIGAGAQGVIHGNGDPRVITPTPNCANSRFYVDDSTGQMYQANSGSPCVWVDPAVSGASLAAHTVVVTAAPYNASGFVVADATQSTVNSGATSIPVANGSQFAIGHAVYVALAGAAGVNYSGTITGISSNTLTVIPATATTVPAGVSVWGLGTTSTSGTTAPGTRVTVANAASYSAGQGVLIAGAGAAGADYVGTISLVAGNNLTVSPATSTSVSTGTVVQHDDTSAFQSTINALSFTGGKIVAPAGIYQINGPFQDTSSTNAILELPKLPDDTNPPGYFPVVVIEIAGTTNASLSVSYLAPNALPGLQGTVLTTTRASTTGAISNAGSGSLIGGSLGGNFTNAMLILRNLLFVLPSNPQIAAVNAYRIAWFASYDTNYTINSSTIPPQPTHPEGVAVIMPQAGNSTMSRLLNSQIIGYYTAVIFSENAQMSNVNAMGNWQCFVMSNNPGYGVFLQDIHAQGCPYSLVAGNTAGGIGQKLNIARLNLEPQTSPVWMTPVADVYDPNGLLSGQVVFDTSKSSLLINGATNLAIRRTENLGRLDELRGSTWTTNINLAPLAVPSGTPTGVASATGGTVAAGSNYAKIVAVDSHGLESLGSTETALVTTTGSTSSITWTWNAVTGAVGYHVYVGSSPGGESNYFGSFTPFYVQVGPISSGTAASVPTVNATGLINSRLSIDPTTGNVVNKVGGVASGYQVWGTNDWDAVLDPTGTFGLAFGLAASANAFSHVAVANDTVVRSSGAGSGGSLILTSQNATGDVVLATGTSSSNDSAKWTVKNSGVLLGFLYSAAGTALPTCAAGLKGALAMVSDATAPTYLGTYTSGGAVTAPVMCNGTSWVMH